MQTTLILEMTTNVFLHVRSGIFVCINVFYYGNCMCNGRYWYTLMW